MSYQIEFNFTGTWEPAEAVVTDLSFNQVFHKGLKSADNSLKGKIIPDITLLNKMRGAGTTDIPARLKEDGTVIFTGYLRKSFNIIKKQRLEPVGFEIVSPSNFLKRKIKTSIFATNKNVVNNIDTNNSLIHLLLDHAGVTSYNIPDISYNIPVFFIEDDSETYHSVLESILFNYGYTFDFDADGTFILYNLFEEYTTITNIFNGTNCLSQIQQTKKEEEKDAVHIKWNNIKSLSNTIVFSDSTNAGTGNKCNIVLGPNTYFGGGDDNNWYAEFDVPAKDLIAVTDATLDIEKDAAIDVELFTPYNMRALVRIKNTDSVFDKTIRKLDIKGTAYYRSGVNISKVVNSDTDKVETVDAKYIYEKTAGDYLAERLASYYKFADFNYTLNSKTNYSLGSFAEVSDTGIGTSQVRVIGKQKELLTGIIKYTLEAVSEYSPATPEYIVRVPAEDRTAQDLQELDLTDIPTFTELQDGYDAGGGTTTPEALELVTRSFIRSISLEWTLQFNLTNLLLYEIQVTDTPAGDWYALRTDGVDWKGEVDTYTEVYAGSRYFFHANIPPAGTEEEPSPRTLSYRIRSKTKALERSAWSDVVEGTTSLVDAPDILAGSITAGKMTVGLLNAMFAQFGNIEVIADGQAFNIDEFHRLLISPYTIRWQSRPDGESAWVTTRMLGHDQADEILADMVRFRGLMPLDREFDYDIGHPRPLNSLTYSFDEKLTDQNDANAWTVDVGTTEYTMGKYGPDNKGAIQAVDTGTNYSESIWQTFSRQVGHTWTLGAWMRHDGAPVQPVVDEQPEWSRGAEEANVVGTFYTPGTTDSRPRGKTCFSPDGRYFISAGRSKNLEGTLWMWFTMWHLDDEGDWNKTYLPPLYSGAAGISRGCDWSKDGKWLCLIHSGYLDFSKVTWTAGVPSFEHKQRHYVASTVSDVSFHPDSNLVFSTGGGAGAASPYFYLSGESWIRYTVAANVGGTFIDWSPCGTYLATSGLTSTYLNIYKKNPTTNVLTYIWTPTLATTGHGYNQVAWSPDSNYVAIGQGLSNINNGKSFNVYKRVGDSFSLLSTPANRTYQSPDWLMSCQGVAFSPDGKYFVATVAGSTSYGSTKVIKTYKREGDTFTEFESYTYPAVGSTGWVANQISFSPDGRYLAMAGATATAAKMGIFKAFEKTQYWDFPEVDTYPRVAQIGAVAGDKVGLYHTDTGLKLAKEETTSVTTALSFPLNQWNYTVIRNNGDGTVTLRVNSGATTLTTTITGTESLKTIFSMLVENDLRIDDLIFFPGIITDETLEEYRNASLHWADVDYGDTYIGCSPGKVVRLMDDAIIEGDFEVTGQIKTGGHPSAPTGVAGAIYFNSTDKHFYGHDGTSWNRLDN